MTVAFHMDGVDVGPRVNWSTGMAWNALHALGYDTTGKGFSGEALDAADVIDRSQHILRLHLPHITLLKALPDGTTISAQEQTLLCIIDIVDLAERTLAAGRKAIRYEP